MGFGSNLYRFGLYLTWGVVFVIAYVYCVKNYGLLLGGGIGWLPSVIVAYVAGLIWPAVIAFAAFMVISGGY
ncbi:hypothetical protein ADMFC3_06120 [Geovibrio sp. ADMFC3]|jgi:hypothetical protein|nr:hypothetical protein [Deferribacteraceae bacterium]